MQKSYKTILESKEVILVVKRSKFIGNALYVRDKEEAILFSNKIKDKYKDATHNVVAYNIKSGGIMYCTDDKEPHGTAGKPTLEVLTKGEIYDICVVITRYFGGVLLGTGGLCFAYSSCCKKILQESTLARCSICEFLKLGFSYKDLRKIENILAAYNVKKVEEKYNEDVCFTIVVEEEKVVEIKRKFLEATNGKIDVTFIKKDWERTRI